MLTMKDIRNFVAQHNHVNDDTVVMVAEEDPTADFDNTGFCGHSLVHETTGQVEDLGVVYLFAHGIEMNTPGYCPLEDEKE